jgi:hypothetical protein
MRGGAWEGEKDADKRICVEKREIPCQETGYRRPWREKKGIAGSKSKAGGGKAREVYSSWDGRDR